MNNGPNHIEIPITDILQDYAQGRTNAATASRALMDRLCRDELNADSASIYTGYLLAKAEDKASPYRDLFLHCALNLLMNGKFESEEDYWRSEVEKANAMSDKEFTESNWSRRS